ncbi:putative galactose-1-phosphate uridyltransferase [Morus notabilis]|uniref:Putative galactose-1-phosphate uridyltransferase n=1 Tax=Morus notabilis TaxID=981085 RepID=W9RRZ1_9ROSA|nr:putative galactose-1-phosphate uridyltransferase [Morus notabilis]
MASAARSPQLRKDAVTNRWGIFSPARAKRPSDFKSKSPTINNWKIRVIQNLYPALSRQNPDSNAVVQDSNANSMILEGLGFHDVVIESPLHSIQLCDLSPQDIGDVVLAYRTRILQIMCYNSIKYVQVFKNHGVSAGASMSHSHSQMLALPIVPPTVSARLDSMKEYFDQTQKCSVCEVQGEDHLIDASTHFISVVPFAASFPFEIWIIPRDHSPHFHEINDEKAADLGGLLKLMLKKLALQLDNPPFNFMIQTSPLDITASELSFSHWFLQIVPQLTGVGGFEIGTGCYINPVFPEDAAKVLREVTLKTSSNSLLGSGRFREYYVVRVYSGCTRFDGETPTQVRCLALPGVDTMTGPPTKMVGSARPESDGSVRIWDATLPVLSCLLEGQVQGIKVAGSSAPVSELDFCYLTFSLALGNECGLVCIYDLKGRSNGTNFHFVTETKHEGKP